MTSDSDVDVSRRRFLRGAAAGAGGATVASQSVAAQEDGGEQPDWGGWLSGIDGGYEDARDQDEVTVSVGAQGNGGAYAFEPAGLWVSSGTTVRWEWTGEGGQHNVHAQEGADFESDLFSEGGVHFEHTFEEGGISTYQCDPHSSLGMKGAVAVGDDVSTVSTGGGGGGEGAAGPQLPGGAKALGVASAGALGTTLALAYLFVKYGGSTATVEE